MGNNLHEDEVRLSTDEAVASMESLAAAVQRTKSEYQAAEAAARNAVGSFNSAAGAAYAAGQPGVRFPQVVAPQMGGVPVTGEEAAQALSFEEQVRADFFREGRSRFAGGAPEEGGPGGMGEIFGRRGLGMLTRYGGMYAGARLLESGAQEFLRSTSAEQAAAEGDPVGSIIRDALERDYRKSWMGRTANVLGGVPLVGGVIKGALDFGERLGELYGTAGMSEEERDQTAAVILYEKREQAKRDKKKFLEIERMSRQLGGGAEELAEALARRDRAAASAGSSPGGW
jgi:hypothetical protein